MATSEKDVLLKISQATSRVTNLDQLLKTSVRISTQAMGVDRCSIWLADDDKRYAMVKTVYVKGRFRPVLLGSRIDLKKFPTFKRIITQKRSIHSPDIYKVKANKSEKEFFAKAKIKSFLSVPLKIRNNVLGAINFGTLKDCRIFTASEKRLGQTIANQIAVGIENARLYKELKERSTRLQEQSIKALQESEKKYRTLVETAQEGIGITDSNENIIFANQAFAELLGCRKEKLLGLNLKKISNKEEFTRFKKETKKRKKGKSSRYEVKLYTKAGELKYFSLNATPIYNEKGTFTGTMGLLTDITKRKEAEQIHSVLYKIADSVHKVRDLHELFRTIHKVLSTVMDTTNFFIALYDKATDTVSLPYCVDQKDRFTTFPAGKTLTAYIMKHDKPILVTKDVRKRLIESGKVETIGARSKIWLGVPLKVGGEVIGVITVQSYTNPLAYGKRELEILKYASTQIASAIQQKKAEEILIRNERIVRERARLLTDLRGLDRIDDILKKVCGSVRESGLFQRAVMTINKPGGEIINLGQVGLPAAEIHRARKAPPLSPKLRAQITNKRFRISDSYFVPAEAGVDFSKTGRYIPQKRKKIVQGNWQTGDELFVPLRDFSGKIMGYLSVDTPIDGYRPDRETIEALELLVEAAASRIREVEAQNAIEKERDFSKSVIETANSLIICLDYEARITAFNEECERITGYRRHEVLGKKWPDMFLPPEYRHKNLKSFARWVRAHPRDQYEGPIKTKKGEIRTILWSNTAIQGFREKDLIAIAIGQDITQRKKTEMALRESEEQFRTIVETAPSLLIITDEKGNNLYVSPNCKEITGYTQKELLGKMKWWVHEDDTAKAKKLFDLSFLKGKGFTNYEYKAIKKNGELWYASSSWEPLRDEKGKFKGIILQTSDVTKHKLAEEALQLSQERYELSTKAAKVGVWDWDLKSNKFYIDPNIKEILGYKDREIPNDINIWTTYVHPEDLKPVMAAAQACIEGKTPEYMVEHRMMHKDGSVRWILSNGKAIRDKNGKAIRMIGTDTDITERKIAEQAFIQSEQRFRMMTEASPDYIFQTDKSGKTIYCSPAIERILGYTPEERQGEKFTTIISPSELPRAKTLFKKVFTGEIIQNLEINLLHKSGRTVPVEVSVVPFFENGKVTRIFGIARDITLRKQSEAALRESEKRYRSLFEDSPISLWEEDFSEVKIYLDSLKKKGIKNFEKYFENHPKDITKCAALVSVLDINQPTLKLFKAKSKEELRRDLRKTFVKESYEAFSKELIAIAEGKKVFETEAVTQNLKGEKNNVLIRWTVAPGYEKTFSKVLVSIIDITERKKAEEAVKESQKFLNDIIDHIPDPLFIKNRKHQWILLNKAICEMLGYPREKMLGKSDYDFFPKKQADFFWKKDEEMFRTGKVVDIPEEPITDAQGNIHWLHTKKAPLKDPSDKISTLVGIIRDITDQKKAVEALRKSKDLNTILQISYKTTQIRELDKMLKLACAETARALGVDRCSVILFDEGGTEGRIRGLYVKDQPYPPGLGEQRLLKDYPMLVKRYRQKKRFLHAPVIDKAPLSRQEKESIKKANVKSLVIVPIDTGKRLLGSFSVATTGKERVFNEPEITFVQTLANHLAVAVDNIRLMELVKAQAENLKILSQRIIGAQEEERKRIAQELHDEIGQDLALMKINMEMSKQNVPSELTQVIERIKDNEALTAETLEKVRNLTTDLRPPLMDDFGLIATLRWYIENFSKRTNIKVTLKNDHYRGRLPLDLEMVLYRITQEALTNVAKHAGATGILILLEKKNNFAILTVKDDGVGFDAKKVLSERKEKKGFGLFSIKERVNLLNGSFNLTSKPKKGTRLQVKIPCPKGR